MKNTIPSGLQPQFGRLDQSSSNPSAKEEQLSPRTRQDEIHFDSMQRHWSFYVKPPRSEQHQTRSPQENLKMAAELGHIDANIVLSKLCLEKPNVNDADLHESIKFAMRALKCFEAIQATNDVANAIGANQTALLRANYISLTSRPEFQSTVGIQPDTGLKTELTPSKVQAIAERVDAGLANIVKGNQYWNQRIAGDVHRLVAHFTVSNQARDAVNLVQKVLEAIYKEKPSWY